MSESTRIPRRRDLDAIDGLFAQVAACATSSVETRLAELLAVASGPASERELGGEAAVVAWYVWNRGTGFSLRRIARPLRAGIAVAAATAMLTTGTAAASYTGVLPTPAEVGAGAPDRLAPHATAATGDSGIPATDRLGDVLDPPRSAPGQVMSAPARPGPIAIAVDAASKAVQRATKKRAAKPKPAPKKPGKKPAAKKPAAKKSANSKASQAARPRVRTGQVSRWQGQLVDPGTRHAGK